MNIGITIQGLEYDLKSEVTRQVRNKNIRKEVNDKFKELWELIYKEKRENLKE